MGNDRKDKFYTNEDIGRVTWIYFNPDSDSGGQYVYNYIYYKHILTVAEQAKTTDSFFDLLGSWADQFLVDVGTVDYADSDKEFKEDPCDLEGCDETTMNKLIEFAKEMSVKWA